MKNLPFEEPIFTSNRPETKSKNKSYTSNKKHLPNLALEIFKCKVELKEISRRLDKYAEKELPETNVVDLLNETRTRILNLYLARKKQTNIKTNKRRKSE